MRCSRCCDRDHDRVHGLERRWLERPHTRLHAARLWRLLDRAADDQADQEDNGDQRHAHDPAQHGAPALSARPAWRSRRPLRCLELERLLHASRFYGVPAPSPAADLRDVVDGSPGERGKRSINDQRDVAQTDVRLRR